MRLGVLDVGSNTVHLLVVDAHYGGAPIPALSHKTDLRLAEYLNAEDAIDERAVGLLADFVAESLEIAQDAGVTEMMAFATSALRDAKNGDEVLAEVANRTGVALEVLSGEDEARLTFLAVRRWFGWSAGRVFVLDIGGGSLELAVGTDEEPEGVVSVPLGAGRLTRLHLADDPPQPAQVKALRQKVRVELGEVASQLTRHGRPELAVATSKTFRQLARIAGAAPASEGLYVTRTLHRDDLREWVPKIAELTATQRAELPGASVGRAHQLVAGGIVAEAAMDIFGLQQVTICPWALREGIILRRLDGIAE